MVLYYLLDSEKENKKYTVINGDTAKIIDFGAKNYKDYIQYSDEDDEKAKIRKDSYIARHKVREDWNDLDKAGTWSRYILWNKPTLNESIRDMERKFRIKIKKL